jgi:hypothetical protein
MCYVTATELKNNLSYYLEKSATEDVYVTKNKKVISIMTNPQLKAYFEFKKYVEELDLHDDGKISDEDIIFEEIMKR